MTILSLNLKKKKKKKKTLKNCEINKFGYTNASKMKSSTMFHISNSIEKYDSSKVKNKTQNALIKWDTQSSEELFNRARKIVISKKVYSLKLEVLKQLLSYYIEKQWVK